MGGDHRAQENKKSCPKDNEEKINCFKEKKEVSD